MRRGHSDKKKWVSTSGKSSGGPANLRLPFHTGLISDQHTDACHKRWFFFRPQSGFNLNPLAPFLDRAQGLYSQQLQSLRSRLWSFLAGTGFAHLPVNCESETTWHYVNRRFIYVLQSDQNITSKPECFGLWHASKLFSIVPKWYGDFWRITVCCRIPNQS